MRQKRYSNRYGPCTAFLRTAVLQGSFAFPSKKGPVWEFPKIRGTLFRGSYSNDPTI